LESLRDLGNTVVVVEHEPVVIRAADHIVDLGPGHGESGGHVVFQGHYRQLLQAKRSLTGAYLSGRARIEIPPRRPVSVDPVARLPGEGPAPAGAADAPRTDTGLSPSAAAAGQPTACGLSPAVRRAACPTLRVSHATRHNLKDLTVDIPLGRFVCVTGVSGSGKTTLVREVLLPALEAKLKAPAARPNAQSSPTETEPEAPGADDAADEDAESRGAPTGAELTGWEHLDRVVLVDQSPLGRTPRSNPAVYIGAFDSIRELFAQSPAAQQRGLTASAFSFNSPQGQCERCRGAGFEKIEMQFLSDVFIRCPECNGRRYRAHILEVSVAPGGEGGASSEGTRPPPSALRPPPSEGSRRKPSRQTTAASRAWTIADLLDATVDEAVGFLDHLADRRPARRAATALRVLQAVGLGYLRLGQPINTLSGGESQRLKLASHLVETFPDLSAPPVNGRDDARTNGQKAKASPLAPTPSAAEPPVSDCSLRPAERAARASSAAGRSTLFLFDEPTTGLHFEDVRVLLGVLQRLVDAGHSVVVIEHNLDVIKCADWVIDLGPEAGDAGGCLVVEGTPEAVAACERSHTGRALREVLAAA
jgi:excinuclease ABC subunit A